VSGSSQVVGHLGIDGIWETEKPSTNLQNKRFAVQVSMFSQTLGLS
jgi:hypothetical protein